MSQGFGIESADALKGSRRLRKQTEVAEIGDIQQSLIKHLGDIKDPRVERTKKHQLIDILIIAIIAGALMLGRHRCIMGLANRNG